MTPPHPELLLNRVLQLDEDLLDPGATREAGNFIEYGECGLAYDVLVFELQEGKYVPSRQALALLKQFAVSMNLVFPQLSTD